MATTQNDYGGVGNFFADAFGINRTKVDPYQVDPNNFKYQRYDKMQGQYEDEIARARAEKAAQMAGVDVQGTQINTQPQGQFRTQQVGLAERLQDKLQTGDYVGKGIATDIYKDATDRAIKQNAALISSARGGVNPNTTIRSAMTQNALSGQQAARDAAITGGQLGLQENLATQQMLAGVSGQGRAQDINLAESQAGLDQQKNLAQANLNMQTQQGNASLEMQQRQQRDMMIRDMLAKGLTLDQAVVQANILMEQEKARNAQFADQLNMGVAQNNANTLGKITGSIISGISGGLGQMVPTLGGGGGAGLEALGAGGAATNLTALGAGGGASLGGFAGQLSVAPELAGAAALSDEREKKKISAKSAAKKITEFLDNLEPAEYEYKNEGYGQGKHISVMAQQMEKSEVGKKFVKEMDNKKFIDYGHALPMMMATIANIHGRLNKVEKRG